MSNNKLKGEIVKMGEKRKSDFGGYATKVGVLCTDGRTIQKDAFKHCDGIQVPLVWQHLHNDPSNILGHATLENRDDGVYCYGEFNETDTGKRAKELVKHGDITNLSIYANELKQKGGAVMHGIIREVSLVLSGANKGAFIDNLGFSHSDGVDETEAIICWDTEENRIIHSIEDQTEPENNKSIDTKVPKEPDELVHAEHSPDATVQEVFDTLDDTQKNVVFAMIAAAIETGNEEAEHSDNEGDSEFMKKNVFDQSVSDKAGPILTRAQIETVMTDARRIGSFKDAFLSHTAEWGIENIDILFPDPRNVRTEPDLIKRDDDWVTAFLNATYKTPFSRIRSMSADLTEDEARAKGYITGKRKKEEVFPVMKRVTTPTTVYKKQKLDRDDMVDITDFDVVAFLKREMRLLLNEELARAFLVGDGRDIASADKIDPMNIRSIWQDDELYTHNMILAANVTVQEIIDSVVRARKFYKGSGNPNFYTTEELITEMMLSRDLNQRRMYNTQAELASALRVSNIIAVEVMEDLSRPIAGGPDTASLIGILVNPRDYTVGADKGGQVSLFDDFDIDFNQYKYLIETRCSGALTKPKSAVSIEKRVAAAQG